MNACWGLLFIVSEVHVHIGINKNARALTGSGVAGEDVVEGRDGGLNSSSAASEKNNVTKKCKNEMRNFIEQETFDRIVRVIDSNQHLLAREETMFCKG